MEGGEKKKGIAVSLQIYAGYWLAFRSYFKRLSLMGRIGMLILAGVFVLGVFSDVLSPHSYRVPSGKPLEPPSVVHWLGTDDLGIDIWSQLLIGARISFIVGLVTALLAGVGGSLIGLFSGYKGGLMDKGLMRITDMMLVLPELPMMILLGAFFGPSLINIILVLALFSWPDSARIVRSKVLSMKEEKYIVISKSFGAGFLHLTLRHFLPAIFPLIMVSFIRLFNRAIIAEAGLSFLGLGDPTTKSWGLMINHAINFKGIYFTDYWKWWVVSPVFAMMLLVTAIAFIGREMERMIHSKQG